MKEIEKDLWKVKADFRVITINLNVKRNGELVMGRGCAQEAAERFPKMPELLGQWLSGNTRYGVEMWERLPVMRDEGLIFFPVKPCEHQAPGSDEVHAGWMCGGKIKDKWCRLKVMQHILTSLPLLVNAADYTGAKKIVMPRPGCGFGGLKWDDVKPWLSRYLDDRFTVCHLPEKVPS